MKPDSFIKGADIVINYDIPPKIAILKDRIKFLRDSDSKEQLI